MVKKWLPLLLLIVFAIISIAALSGLARNVAQKRILVSDPLYRTVGKKKPHRIARNLPQAKELATARK
ncbi:MAG: hypothetical protein ABI167_05110 [Nitrosospira sp.]